MCCVQVQRVKRAMQSIADNAEGDGRALCVAAGGPLDPTKLGTRDAQGNLRVRLYRSKAASCKHGQFLVRSTDARLHKRDYYAYVPYSVGGSESEEHTEGAEVIESTVLKVTGIYAWHEPRQGGQPQIHRFVIGRMQALDPHGEPSLGFEMCYADGTDGNRARKPSLLKKRGTQSYVYGAWLSQIDCTMVSSLDEKWFIPTLKLAHFG